MPNTLTNLTITKIALVKRGFVPVNEGARITLVKAQAQTGADPPAPVGKAAGDDITPDQAKVSSDQMPNVAADGSHAPWTGTHSHPHPACDSDTAGTNTHTHPHTHRGDADHTHPDQQPAAPTDGKTPAALAPSMAVNAVTKAEDRSMADEQQTQDPVPVEKAGGMPGVGPNTSPAKGPTSGATPPTEAARVQVPGSMGTAAGRKAQKGNFKSKNTKGTKKGLVPVYALFKALEEGGHISAEAHTQAVAAIKAATGGDGGEPDPAAPAVAVEIDQEAITKAAKREIRKAVKKAIAEALAEKADGALAEAIAKARQPLTPPVSAAIAPPAPTEGPSEFDIGRARAIRQANAFNANGTSMLEAIRELTRANANVRQ